MLTIVRKGLRTDGSHFTKLQRVVADPIFGSVIQTAFISTEAECPLAEGATIEREPIGVKLEWKA